MIELIYIIGIKDLSFQEIVDLIKETGSRTVLDVRRGHSDIIFGELLEMTLSDVAYIHCPLSMSGDFDPHSLDICETPLVMLTTKSHSYSRKLLSVIIKRTYSGAAIKHL